MMGAPIARNLTTLMGVAERDPLNSPMVFIAGPRQVGKTFVARQLSRRYHNWDTVETKKAFLRDPHFFRDGPGWIVFDEIHKRRDWKSLMKGYFDSPDRGENFVVTGSGRFEVKQRGGDSLQGRYDLFHLYPLTPVEAVGAGPLVTPREPRFRDFQPADPCDAESHLIRFGGFPEPFLRGSATFLNKWMDLYISRLVREDVRDFSQVSGLDKIEMLARILPQRLRAPISNQSLAEDVEVSRETIKSWLRLFELLYLGYSLPPYSRKIHRAVKRERKWYFFQWCFAESEADRFENYLATQLLTACRFWRDAGLGVYELWYLRDQDRREIDFVITRNLAPVALIEAKLSDDHWHSALDHFADKLGVPAFLVCQTGRTRRIAKDRWVVPSSRFLTAL